MKIAKKPELKTEEIQKMEAVVKNGEVEKQKKPVNDNIFRSNRNYFFQYLFQVCRELYKAISISMKAYYDSCQWNFYLR